MRLPACLLAVLAVAPCATGQTVDPRRLIVPGTSVGVVRLGMTAPEAHAALESVRARSTMLKDGKPAGYRDARANAVIEIWEVDPIGDDRFLGQMKVFYVGPKVVQITIGSPLYVTAKGANLRMTSDQLKRVHSSIGSSGVTETWSGKVRLYDSQRLGIGVTYLVGDDGKERGGAQEAIVHEPGTPARMETYRPKGDKKDAAPAAPAVPAPAAPAVPTPPAEPEPPTEPVLPLMPGAAQ